MSDVRSAPLEVVQTTPTEGDECWHIVCHCTGDNLAACGLDMTDAPWSTDDDDRVCPLCMLAWPDDSPACPWDCSCEECGP